MLCTKQGSLCTAGLPRALGGHCWQRMARLWVAVACLVTPLHLSNHRVCGGGSPFECTGIMMMFITPAPPGFATGTCGSVGAGCGPISAAPLRPHSTWSWAWPMQKQVLPAGSCILGVSLPAIMVGVVVLVVVLPGIVAHLCWRATAGTALMHSGDVPHVSVWWLSHPLVWP